MNRELDNLTNKLYLRQIDNYGIYDIYCIDRPKSVEPIFQMRLDNWEISPPLQVSTGRTLIKYNYQNQIPLPIDKNELNNFIAVQHYHTTLPIFRFNELIERYYDRPNLTTHEGMWTERVQVVSASIRNYSGSGGFYGNGSTEDTSNYQLIEYPVDTTGATIIEIYTDFWFRRQRTDLKLAFWTKKNNYDIIDKYPTYQAFIEGYELDSRKKPQGRCEVTASQDKVIKVSYWRENKLEEYPNLTTLDYYSYSLNLKKDEQAWLLFEDCCLSSLLISDSEIADQVKNQLDRQNNYPYRFFLVGSDPELFEEWKQIYQERFNLIPEISGRIIDFLFENEENRLIRFSEKTVVRYPCILRKIAADNNYWNNDYSNNSDLNYQSDHPLFSLDPDKEHDFYFVETPNGSYGNLIMDSPRIVAIEQALDAINFSTNSIDPDAPRVSNLGHLIKQTAFLLGYRPDDNGKFSKEQEKQLVRKVITESSSVDPNKVGVNNFGEQGMMIRNINNKFKGQDIVNDRISIVRDIPQLMSLLVDFISQAIGAQESTATQVQTNTGSAKYRSQLELLTEIASQVHSISELAQSALTSSLIAQAQTNEIIAAMGLPSVTKTIPIDINGKIADIPYNGVAADRSLSKEIATATYNVGIGNGNTM